MMIEMKSEERTNIHHQWEPMLSHEIIWPERWGRCRIYANQMGKFSSVWFFFIIGFFPSLVLPSLRMRNCDQWEIFKSNSIQQNNEIFCNIHKSPLRFHHNFLDINLRERLPRNNKRSRKKIMALTLLFLSVSHYRKNHINAAFVRNPSQHPAIWNRICTCTVVHGHSSVTSVPEAFPNTQISKIIYFYTPVSNCHSLSLPFSRHRNLIANISHKIFTISTIQFKIWTS